MNDAAPEVDGELPSPDASGSVWARFQARLFAPVDVASLVVFRVFFGAIMLLEVGRFFKNEWIRIYYISPDFHFKYYGFEWVHPWPGDGMYYHFVAVAIFSLGVVFGVCYRLSALLLFVSFTHWFLLDQARYLNHLYLVALLAFLMIVLPCHRARSIDAWWRPKVRSDTVPTWCLWLLRFQVGLVYFFAGIAKLNEDWLRGAPIREWLAKRSDYPLVGQFFTETWCVFGFAYGGLLFDLLVAPLLLWRRTRVAAFLVTIFFHLTNKWLFDIGIFPWLMLAATTIFFPADWPRRQFFLVGPRTGSPTVPSAASSSPDAGGHLPSRLVLTGLGLWIAFQLFMPVRHWLYPGNVHWTEEGHRFAWHMKLRDKSGRVRFTVTDRDSGRWVVVDPRDHLTSKQTRWVATRPDMLLQFAHHLAEEYRGRWGVDVEVRARAQCSLNGRDRQALVDPSIDLATVRRSLRTADWLLPLSTPLPDPAGAEPGAKK